MDKEHLLQIIDRLAEKGYNLYPLSKEQEIYEGFCGFILRATHETKHKWKGEGTIENSLNSIENYLLLIFKNILSLDEIDAVCNRVPRLERFAIEREYVAYISQEDIAPATLDQMVYHALQEKKPLFSKSASACKRVGWATDIHLNFLEAERRAQFIRTILDQNLDCLILTGDIAESKTFVQYLKEIEAKFLKPVYFVLGNHDFYWSSIENTKLDALHLSEESPYLRWLPDAGIVRLSKDIALIGHEGWGDGGYGDFENSHVVMNDHFLIQEFQKQEKKIILQKLRQLGEESASYFIKLLPIALESYSHVIIATHVPPFDKASTYDGRMSDKEYLPFFCCKAVGDVLTTMMKDRPDKKVTVLCGHTHGVAVVRTLPNIVVVTGDAEYGHPALQTVFEIPV